MIAVLLCSFAAVVTQPEQLVQKLEDYLSYYTPEKVYLHTDKPYYAAGDTIWFAAYLTHGVSHMATAPSKIVYVELINEEKEVLARRDIGINQGTGNGEFALAGTLQGGQYLLRGYTSFMRNFDQRYFFHKEIRIEGLSYDDETGQPTQVSASGQQAGSLSKLVSVQFFPEGGDLVSGLWSTEGSQSHQP